MHFEPPTLRGWPRVQAWLVDRIKRAALVQLHSSDAGEVFLLRIYLVGEQATEQALQQELLTDAPSAPAQPEWLPRQVARHLAEEQTHAHWFTQALTERGAAMNAMQADALSRRKIAKWRGLAKRYEHHFSSGLWVPAYAIALCAEQMAVRVLQRHCAVLASEDTAHPLRELLERVLADETRHVRQCAHVLERIVPPMEHDQLRALLIDIRAIERSFGVIGALAMLGAGFALRMLPGPAPQSA